MPTYAYACKDCSHAFDIVQSFTDSTLTSCPECEGTLRKKFNTVGVVFKGSGFYRTDSRAKTGEATSKSESSKSEPKSESKTDSTKSESKPATASKPAAAPAA